MRKLPVLLIGFSVACLSCHKEEESVTFAPADLRFEQSMEWNANHPFRTIRVTDDNYSVYCMGDSHVGVTKNLDQFCRHAKDQNAVAMVMAGDLTAGSESDYALFQEHVQNPDSMPSFCLIGNHDLYQDGWNQFFSRFGSSSYLFVISTPVAEDLFICLDTANGTLGRSQLNWLRELLKSKRPNYRHCLVFTHNNFFLERHTESSALSIEELEVLVELFTANKVDMEISGHDHKHAAKTLGNTTYLIMDALMDGLENSGYLVIGVRNGNLDYQFMHI